MSEARTESGARAGGRGSRRPIYGGTVLLAALGTLIWSLWPSGTPTHGFQIVAEYPHDPLAYTQGLLWADGALYESTGRHGTSSVRRVELESGEVKQRFDLPADLFGEGLVLFDERLIQLTWYSGLALVYDRATLEFREQIGYDGEGWGLTTDGRYLIQSDGTDVLRFRDPRTFEEVRRLRVSAGDQRVVQLNELEWIDGEVWANLWKSEFIARIDPDTGEVLGWVDLRGLFDHSHIPDEDAVLNGIAYDAEGDRLFVTGKLWPRLFEIKTDAL